MYKRRKRKIGRIVTKLSGKILLGLVLIFLFTSISCCCGGMMFSGCSRSLSIPTSTISTPSATNTPSLVVTTAYHATNVAAVTIAHLPTDTPTATSTPTITPTPTSTATPTASPILTLEEQEYLEYIGHKVSLIHGSYIGSLGRIFNDFLENRTFYRHWEPSVINADDKGWEVIYPMFYWQASRLNHDYIELKRGYSVFSQRREIPPRFTSIHQGYVEAADTFFAVTGIFVKALNERNSDDMAYAIEQMLLSKTQIDVVTAQLSVILEEFGKTPKDVGFSLWGIE